MKKHKKFSNSNRTEKDDGEGNELDEYEAFESDGNESDELLDELNEKSEESSEEEVLPVHSESESEEEDEHTDDDDDGDIDISDSDIDQPKDESNNLKSWGKKAKNYYDANRIDTKTKFTNEEDEELAKMEEMEAMSIQQRLLSELDGLDLSVDLLGKRMAAEQTKDEEILQDDKIVWDFSTMDESERKKLLKKNSPELFTYIDDYKRLMNCVKGDLLPVLEELKNKKLDKSNAAEFTKIFYQIIMNYCTNITFYLMLKTRKSDTLNHPVSKWITKYQEMLKESEPIYNNTIKSQLKSILKSKPSITAIKRKTNSKNSEVKMKSLKLDAQSDVVPKTNSVQPQLHNESSESDNEEQKLKRAITYQIAKNKGLTPHRKKELRNPRVKHRMKYRKAKIRRKGQVREVRKELQKYGGEISGIKAGVVKSVRFKV